MSQASIPSGDGGGAAARPKSFVERQIWRFAVPVVILVALAGGGLAMCGLPGDSLDSGDGIVGTYVVNGVDPLGIEYSGTVMIREAGTGYAVQWLITGSIQEGTGTLVGNRFVVDWRTVTVARGPSSGTAEYVVGDDGVLRGERTVVGVDQVGTEEIFPET